MAKKKQEMIQTSINRREPVDEAAIDEEISKLREEMIKEALDTVEVVQVG